MLGWVDGWVGRWGEDLLLTILYGFFLYYWVHGSASSRPCWTIWLALFLFPWLAVDTLDFLLFLEETLLCSGQWHLLFLFLENSCVGFPSLHLGLSSHDTCADNPLYLEKLAPFRSRSFLSASLISFIEATGLCDYLVYVFACLSSVSSC